MKPARVFYADLAEGPDGGQAWSVTAKDGTRLRIGTWLNGTKGTIVTFPGRNEHIEKYGRVAAAFERRGWSVTSIDWRGQGMSDRVAGTEPFGHIDRFEDYQIDVVAYLDTIKALGAPEPYMLLAHSMGGAIGLRALHEGLDVSAAAFSAPMWGIHVPPLLRPVARILSTLASYIGLGRTPIPVGTRGSYFRETPFAKNSLTSDENSYDYLVAQAQRDDRLALGRPTLRWLSEAMREVRWLHAIPQPNLPLFVATGSAERTVDNKKIRKLIAKWQDFETVEYEGARHELMMELPKTRENLFDRVEALFEAARSGSTSP